MNNNCSIYLSLVCTLQAKTGSGEVDLTFQTSLAGFATSIHVVTLVPSSPAVRMNLQGQLAYNDPLATNKRLFFDTTIPTSDFIRYMYYMDIHTCIRAHTYIQCILYTCMTLHSPLTELHAYIEQPN